MEQWTPLLPPDTIQKAQTLLARADALRHSGSTIYPPQDTIFAALTLTPPEAVKAVILGQDPYHGEGQANGLAFSVSDGIPLPPSLRNIYKELSADLGITPPKSGNLEPWAREGVLLLNTALTVEAGRPNSHKAWGWDAVVFSICSAVLTLPQPVVFLLWGKYAHGFLRTLDISRYPGKIAFKSSHPSPLGATKAMGDIPAFLGSRPFSRTNAYLTEQGQAPIHWQLPEGK